ncbi:hypothetical protein BD626DRAFT_89333 [Schizophyllum amplum]|uniref:F-box domain-containing protein n=1 Tax=Schizophyllum amplum TaxID=97359 RepID=A0A550C8D1_9AGAR|nr:hypothetical protein BD626DRAFT_89333 [Auriculariopsis ampla]
MGAVWTSNQQPHPTMSHHYSYGVQETSRRPTQTQDDGRITRMHQNNHLNASATPVVHAYPYAHAQVASPHQHHTSAGDAVSRRTMPFRNALGPLPGLSPECPSIGSSIHVHQQGLSTTYDDHQHAGYMLNPPSGMGVHAPPSKYIYSGLPKYQSPWSMPSLPSVPHVHRGRGPYTPPISRLPPEVLSLMFLHTTPLQLSDATPGPRTMPVVLSHVCSYWRAVAIDLPHLWLWLSISSCPTRHEHRRMELAQAYMNRAKGMGMAIHYRDAEADMDSEPESFRAFSLGMGVRCARTDERCFCAIDLIVARIAEIRVLELVVGHASIFRLSAIPPSSLTSLRNLTVWFLEGGEAVRALSNLYLSSPGIRHLTWAPYLRACTIPPPPTVPWAQLDTVHLYKVSITITDFLNMLAIGQQLKDVFVRLAPDPLPFKPLQQRICQRMLETLAVDAEDPLDDAFNHLHLPSLRDFTLQSLMDQQHVWPFYDPLSLYHFVEGITPGLESFELSPGGTMMEDALIQILSLPQMSRLKRLHLRLSLVSDIFFSHLKVAPERPILQHLQELRIAKCVTKDGTIGHMIRSRHKYSYPLRHLHISFMRQEEGLHQRDRAEFRRLRGYGLYIRDSY